MRKKVFFSEEKKQKTFARLSRFHPAAYAESQKLFWVVVQRTTPSFRLAFPSIPTAG
jgi:hypothetical protein